MKKLFIIMAVLFIASIASAVPVTVVEGPADALGIGDGGDAATLEGEPGSFYLNYSSHSGNIKKENVPNWGDIVCQVTECNGVHTHTYGEDACGVSFKSISTVRIVDGCSVHLDGGMEYDFEPGEFPNINPDFVNSSVWIGINSSGIVQQTGEFTNTQRLSIAPLARIQSEGTAGPIATIMDVRFKTTAFEWRFHNWVRDFIGALAGSGLETSEIGTRNLSTTGGTFSDTEIDGHTTPAFSAISGLLVHTTAFSPATTIEGLLQADNLQYDTGSGLATMTNNNWYASHNLAMSAAGGIVNGIDTGRGPTFLLIYSDGQWNSLGEALEQPFNLGPFAGSKDIIRLSRLIVQKNSAGITQIVQVQPFNTSGSGTGVAGTSSMNEVYNNSPNGDTPEITTNTTNNDVTIRYGGNNGKIAEFQKANGDAVLTITTSFHPGLLIQHNHSSIEPVLSTTATILQDNNTPQCDTSFTVFSSVFIPVESDSTINIVSSLNHSHSAVDSRTTCIVCKDSNLDALDATHSFYTGSHKPHARLTIDYTILPRDRVNKLPRTYKIKCGDATVGTLYINGQSSGTSLFGNTWKSTYNTKEYK